MPNPPNRRQPERHPRMESLDESMSRPAVPSRLTPSLTYVYDLERQHNTYFAGSLLEHLGFPQNALNAIGADFFRLYVHEADRARLAAHHDAMRSQPDDGILEIEYRVRIPSGEWRRLKSCERPFTRDRSGRCVTQILGAAKEIADRK
jgi:PAS domain-containing protein